MYLYKSVSGVVTHKRLAINSTTGVELPDKHSALDELVERGVLTREKFGEVVLAPVVEPTISPKEVTELQVDTPQV